MRFPSKITPYRRSIFVYFPQILSVLEERDITPSDLADELKIDAATLGDFISALDCLYAMRKIDFNEKGMELHYVGKPSM